MEKFTLLLRYNKHSYAEKGPEVEDYSILIYLCAFLDMKDPAEDQE